VLPVEPVDSDGWLLMVELNGIRYARLPKAAGPNALVMTSQRVRDSAGIAGAGSPTEMPAVLELLDGWRPGKDDRRGRLVVRVADPWLPMAVVPWSDAHLRSTGAIEAARQCLRDSGFDIAAEDTIRLESAPFGEPRLAVAYPAALLSSLGRCSSTSGLRLSSVMPFGYAQWARRRREADASFVSDSTSGSLYVSTRDRRCVADVVVRRWTSEGEEHVFIARERLRRPTLSATTVIAGVGPSASSTRRALSDALKDQHRDSDVVQGETADASTVQEEVHSPADYCTDIDAVRNSGPARPRVVATAIAATTFCAALAIGWSSLASTTAKLVAAQHLASRTPTLDEMPRSQIVDALRTDAVAASVRVLNLPLLPILSSLKPLPEASVLIQSVEIVPNRLDRGTGRSVPHTVVRLVARAASEEDLFGYLRTLSDRVGQPVRLSRHEYLQGESGMRWQFSADLVWAN
jgi:hypothetical protein